MTIVLVKSSWRIQGHSKIELYSIYLCLLIASASTQTHILARHRISLLGVSCYATHFSVFCSALSRDGLYHTSLDEMT